MRTGAVGAPPAAPAPLAALGPLGFAARKTAPGPAEPICLERGGLRSGAYGLVLECAAMGTRVTLTAIHPSRSLLDEAAGRAFEDMGRLIDLLSRFDPRSALSALNDRGHLRLPPPELLEVLEGSRVAHRLSAGRFDVTVKPVVDLLAASTSVGAGQGPDETDWRKARELVGARRVRFSPREVALERAGMGLTLDGLAKGYIVDAMCAHLESCGVERYLVDGGGDVRASGLGPDGGAWNVAVRDPRGSGTLPETLSLVRGALATSGGYEAFFDDAGTWHHIVDAGTGRSPHSCLSVTVRGPSAFAADALATAALLMAPTTAIRFVDSLPGFEALVIDADGRLRRSSGWTPAPPCLLEDTMT